MHGQVKGATTIHTDGWKAYDGLVWDGFKHHRVHHHENEFARGKRHINGIESFWSFAKTRLAKQRGVRADSFRSTSKNPSGVGIIAVITFTRCS